MVEAERCWICNRSQSELDKISLKSNYEMYVRNEIRELRKDIKSYVTLLGLKHLSDKNLGQFVEYYFDDSDINLGIKVPIYDEFRGFFGELSSLVTNDGLEFEFGRIKVGMDDEHWERVGGRLRQTRLSFINEDDDTSHILSEPVLGLMDLTDYPEFCERVDLLISDWMKHSINRVSAFIDEFELPRRHASAILDDMSLEKVKRIFQEACELHLNIQVDFFNRLLKLIHEYKFGVRLNSVKVPSVEPITVCDVCISIIKDFRPVVAEQNYDDEDDRSNYRKDEEEDFFED